MRTRVYASILDAPGEDVQLAIDKVSPYVDAIHYDVMDGKFVPPTAFSAAEFRKLSIPLFKSVHLMVEHPDKRWIDDFASAGADEITIHFEAKQKSVLGTIRRIKQLGCRAGLSIKPKTKVDDVPEELWRELDFVLVMTVEPGWGGQKFMTEVLDKVRRLRNKYPDLSIGVDGGINDKTAKLAVEAGCNVLAAGSYLLKSENYEAAVKSLLS